MNRLVWFFFGQEYDIDVKVLGFCFAKINL